MSVRALAAMLAVARLASADAQPAPAAERGQIHARITGEALHANTLDLRLGTLSINFQDVVAEPRMQDKLLVFANCRARAYGGTVTAWIGIDLEHPRQRYRIDLAGVDLGVFLRTCVGVGVEDGTGGTVDGFLELSIPDGKAEKMEGRGELRISRGDLLRLPALANLLFGAPGNPTGKDSAVARLEIRDGVIRLRSTRIASPSADIVVRGTIDLRSEGGGWDLVIIPRAGAHLFEVVPAVGDLASWLIGAASTRLFRATVRGPLGSPVLGSNPFAD